MGAPKVSFAELGRKYGLDENAIKAGPKGLRYRNPVEKGIYWYWFSKFVRLRDAQMWGCCISCGKPKSFDGLQGGHFAPAGNCGFKLLFDERNVNGECGGCNAYDQSHLWGYEINLNKRYGAGTAEGIKAAYAARHTNITQEWSPLEYATQIPIIKARYEALLSTGTSVQ